MTYWGDNNHAKHIFLKMTTCWYSCVTKVTSTMRDSLTHQKENDRYRGMSFVPYRHVPTYHEYQGKSWLHMTLLICLLSAYYLSSLSDYMLRTTAKSMPTSDFRSFCRYWSKRILCVKDQVCAGNAGPFWMWMAEVRKRRATETRPGFLRQRLPFLALQHCHSSRNMFCKNNSPSVLNQKIKII